MNKNSPNFNLSKSMIGDALFKLMEKKEFSKITIKELTDAAQLARRTFYKHFETKEDVLRYKLIQLNEQYISELEKVKITSPEEYGRFFFTFCKKYEDILIVLIKHNLLFSTVYRLYKEYMSTNIDVVEKLKINTSKYNIVYRYGGIFFMLIEWVENGFAETPETMAMLFAKEIKD